MSDESVLDYMISKTDPPLHIIMIHIDVITCLSIHNDWSHDL